MRLQMLVSAGVLLAALLPSSESRTLSRPATLAMSSQQTAPLQFQPFLLRMGEEYFIRLGNLDKHLPSALPGGRLPEAFQQLQLLQQGAEAGELRAGLLGGEQGPYTAPEEPTERGKRSEDPPISLDLTFHLLREVLEMARAEQIAHQAHSNRKLMDTVGK
ncbi:corticoliberin [Ambystoma mexicanum]|uniref:corticoliberin n=1 Tax=Ambystoma mexicanum TaxID=8296 RepID=UPI0037E9AE38